MCLLCMRPTPVWSLALFGYLPGRCECWWKYICLQFVGTVIATGLAKDPHLWPQFSFRARAAFSRLTWPPRPRWTIFPLQGQAKHPSVGTHATEGHSWDPFKFSPLLSSRVPYHCSDLCLGLTHQEKPLSHHRTLFLGDSDWILSPSEVFPAVLISLLRESVGPRRMREGGETHLKPCQVYLTLSLFFQNFLIGKDPVVEVWTQTVSLFPQAKDVFFQVT